MKIAFFTIDHKGPMYGGLIKEFAKNGHDVTVIVPKYSGKSEIKKENNIDVLYFWSLPLLNINLISKGIANYLLPYLSLHAVKKKLINHNFDLIISPTPPLAYYKAIDYLKKKNPSAKFYLILRDILPESARFIGLDKIKPIFKYFRNIEKKNYELSDIIGCLSPKNIEFLKEKNPQLSINKLELLPNWRTPTSEIIIDKKQIRKKYNLEDKFVIVYGGNMGIPQGLEAVIKLAEIKQKLLDVVFLFIGQGTEKKKLENLVSKKKINNVRFYNAIPQSDYIKLMCICDIGIISLHPNLFIPCIPSKTIGYWAVKLPILALVDSLTDYGSYVIESSKSGLWSLSSDIKKTSENFDILYNNRNLRKSMGKNGFNYFIENCTSKITYTKIIQSIR
tara:strand:+ start:1869 stop:3044 length:1176 start_codon:yes stop_codon:yes gene_type:complete